MDLDELERRGHIKRLPMDVKKIEDSLNLAKRDVNVARSVLNENCDWAFSIAYNAMLQAVRALMFKGIPTYWQQPAHLSHQICRTVSEGRGCHYFG